MKNMLLFKDLFLFLQYNLTVTKPLRHEICVVIL
jgi:hypothetical protein